MRPAVRPDAGGRFVGKGRNSFSREAAYLYLKLGLTSAKPGMAQYISVHEYAHVVVYSILTWPRLLLEVGAL